jgi:hypothetical protein
LRAHEDPRRTRQHHDAPSTPTSRSNATHRSPSALGSRSRAAAEPRCG